MIDVQMPFLLPSTDGARAPLLQEQRVVVLTAKAPVVFIAYHDGVVARPSSKHTLHQLLVLLEG